jgi:hypothetical protein
VVWKMDPARAIVRGVSERGIDQIQRAALFSSL